MFEIKWYVCSKLSVTSAVELFDIALRCSLVDLWLVCSRLSECLFEINDFKQVL